MIYSGKAYDEHASQGSSVLDSGSANSILTSDNRKQDVGVPKLWSILSRLGVRGESPTPSLLAERLTENLTGFTLGLLRK